MKITELYIYPIKALAPLSVARARLMRDGVEHDRRFMLVKITGDKKTPYKPVQTDKHPEAVVLKQHIDNGDIVVTGPPVKDGSHGRGFTIPQLRVPLYPQDLESLETLEVTLGGSAVHAHRMGADPYDDWFSARLGYPVILVYIGMTGRPVLAHEPSKHYLWRQPRRRPPVSNEGWLSSISNHVPSLLGGGGVIDAVKEKGMEASRNDDENEKLAFNECAPFLVTSKASLRDVSARLPEGEEMEMRKFRPNIVIDNDDSNSDNETATATDQEGTDKLKAWEEDYWGELVITSKEGSGGHRLALTANCARCISINIDYEKGTYASGELGNVLKKLMKDRRVDPGNKWEPIFGRYAFLAPGDDGGGVEIAVGDDVSVARRLDYRDAWEWPKH
ncbi:hypothetical protein F5Y16DRAFT_324683 [Xylariaceae sp. FL0255]|nr:hypothetical protein F5Y16DRAFT_324683 [Xylariaceae sp. FL0255]